MTLKAGERGLVSEAVWVWAVDHSSVRNELNDGIVVALSAEVTQEIPS